MPVILVVDDSAVDQVLITELLKRESLDWVIEAVGSAEQAIHRLEEFSIDLVVTDVVLPGMSGLELLDVVHKQHRQVPVVVVSGQGSESMAVDALHRGAASYVPKQELAGRLNESVKQVLEIVESQQDYSTLAPYAKEVSLTFEFANDPSLISGFVHLVQQLACGVNLFGNEGRTRLGIAIDEAMLNAMYHGNLELPAHALPVVREQLRDGQRVESIETRREMPPYSDRAVHVSVHLTRESICVGIRDEGNGFDSNAARASDANRGMVLVENLVDEVTFNDIGNEVRLVKHREVEEETDVPVEW